MKEKQVELLITRQKMPSNHLKTLITCLLSILVFTSIKAHEGAKYNESSVDSESKLLQFQVSGIMIDKDGTPLPGANILEKGTTNGVQTDFDGKFSISVSDQNAVLVVSYIGFHTQEVPVGERSNITVTLEESAAALDEVIAVGYSLKRKADLTGAVGVVDVANMTRMPVAGIDQALQGQVAGVNVTSTGRPGGKSTIRIRGLGTTGNNDPLYIVDGVPTKDGINMLNPADIESIQILKDASSSAIYGSRAGNGVIIVTTKKGRSEETRFTFDAYYGTKYIASNSLPESASPIAAATRVRDSWLNEGQTPFHQQYNFNGNDITIDDYLDAEQQVKANKSGTDWFDELIDPGTVQNYNIGMSQGGKNGYKNMSISYYNEEGIFIHTGYERITARMNSAYSFLDDKLKIGQNFSASFGKSKGLGTGDLSSSIETRGGLQSIYSIPTVIPVRDINGEFAGPTNKGGLGDDYNPIGAYYRNRDDYNNRFKLFGNVFVELELLKNLVFKTNLGLDYTTDRKFDYSASFVEYIHVQPVAGVSVGRYLENNLIWNNTLNYTFSKDDHNFEVLAGTEAIDFDRSYLTGSGSGYFDESLDNLLVSFAEDSKVATDFRASYALFSIFGKIDYDYKGKYLASFTIRDDASSRFAPENRHAIFPAASAGWRVSREDWFDYESINNLKIRVGWGKTGNQEIGDYAYFNSYSKHYDIETNFAGTFYGSVADYDVTGNGSIDNGIILDRKTNRDIKWETSEQINIGFDLGLGLGPNNMSLSFDYFKKNTFDVLAQVATPIISGRTSNEPFRNLGEIENKGVEIAMDFKTDTQKDLVFDANINLAFLKNEVIDLGGYSYRGNNGIGITEEGAPISSFFGYTTQGIFQTEAEVLAAPTQNSDAAIDPGKYVGTLKFKDINGDGIIDDEDRGIIGSPHPKFMASTRLGAAYKNFDFSLFLNGAFGHEVYNLLNGNSQSYATDYWTPSNTGAKWPKPVLNDLSGGRGLGDLPVQNASFLRIQNLQFGYNVPEKVISKLKFSSLRVYALAQNLATFTNYTGLDPEVGVREDGTANTNFSIGVDRAHNYPNPTTLSLGVNLSF